MNIVQVFGDAVGTTLYYGKGAGSEPTASAVIARMALVPRTMEARGLDAVPGIRDRHTLFERKRLR